MAPKRARTPLGDLPASKRSRNNISSHTHLTFNQCFSDELVLAIFANLSATELCSIQVVDSHWARLSNDNFLWKALFASDFPSQRLRGARGFSSQWVSEFGPTGRQIKPLPARARLNENQIVYFPFKWMYRVSRNWRRGRCAVEHIDDQPFTRYQDLPSTKPPSSGLLLAGDLIIYTTQFTPGTSGVVVRSVNGTSHLIPFERDVSCMALDQSTSLEVPADSPLVRNTKHVHLACFHSKSEFSIISIPPEDPSQATITRYSSNIRRSQSTVQHAIYKHPLLVTMTSDLELLVWDLEAASSTGRLGPPVHAFRSFSSFPPVSLSLASSPDNWKLLVSYCTPVYPSHWLPAASELTISRKDGCRITDSRKTKSYIASSHGWATEEARQEMEAEWARKLADVQIIETDGKFLVAAGQDNLLQVYRLHYRSEFRLQYLRTLNGHISSVVALKVADGRCVSASADGTLRVWDLEGGWDVEVDSLQSPTSETPLAIKDLCFDERRAVALGANGDSLRIWRFDL